MFFSNKNLHKKKKINHELKKILGINKKTANLICDRLGIGKDCLTQNLPKTKKVRLRLLLDKPQKILPKKTILLVEEKKTNEKIQNINKLKMLNTYKGLRHVYQLPCRGQRTHTNGKKKKRS